MSNFVDYLRINNIEKIKELISQGLELDKCDEYGYTPLIHSVIQNNIEVAKLLIESKSDVNASDITGWSALQWAADDNLLDFCELFLKHGANPDHYSMDGQPTLVYPLLRKQKELLKLFLKYKADFTFAEDFIDAKLIGHRFELKGKTYVVTPDYTFVEIGLEGFYIESTLGFLHHSLLGFLGEVESRFASYLKSTKEILNALDEAPKLVQRKYKRNVPEHELVIKEVYKKELILIPVTFEGHAITMIKYGNLFARCDRGVKKVVDTIVIYYMENSLLFTEKFLKDLIYENKTSDFMHKEIKDVLKLKQIISIPTESQLSGNCSWANVEASIPAMLFMLMFNGDLHDSSHIYSLRKKVLNFYDAWVEFDKDKMLKRQLSTFNKASPLRKASKVFSIGSIFEQRCDYRKKNEVRRAKKILEILTIKDYMNVLQAYIRANNHPMAGQKGEDFMMLLDACGINKSQALSILRQDFGVNKDLLQQEETEYNDFIDLLTAADSGQVDEVEKILAKDKSLINKKNASGNTVLMYAAWNGYIDMINFLVKNGADKEIRNHKGARAIDFAKYANNIEVVKILYKN